MALIHLQFFKVGEIMVSNYECPGAFPDKVTPDIDSTDEAVFQYDVLDIKILF